MPPYRAQYLICKFQHPSNTEDWNGFPSFAPKLTWQHNLSWIDVRLWIAFPYCIIAQFSVNMVKSQYISITDLDLLSAVLCYIPCMHPMAFPSFKNFLNSELYLPLRCSDMRLLTRIVLFHIHEGELRTGQLPWLSPRSCYWQNSIR